MSSKIWFRFLLLFAPLSVMAQLGPDSLRFAIIADPQYADKASTTDRCYRNTIAKMNTAITFLNTQAPAFLLILGDYVDAYTNAVADTAKTITDINALNAEVSKFNGPIYQVLGNHDEASLNKSEWMAKVVASIKKNYYSFDVGPFHFVVMDGNYSPNGKDFGRIDPWVWNSALVPAEERDWLIADLDKAGTRPTIVSIHENLNDSTDYSVGNASEIRNVLKTHGNVTHVLQGHRHEGGYVKINGIHYLTQQAMVNCPAGATSTGNNFSLVTLKDSTMRVDGYYGTPDRVLPNAGLLQAAWPTAVNHAMRAARQIKLTSSFLEMPEGSHTVHVLGMDGRLIATRSGVGAQSYSLEELTRAVPGMYVLSIRGEWGLISKILMQF